jgi:hypothetical protein
MTHNRQLDDMPTPPGRIPGPCGVYRYQSADCSMNANFIQLRNGEEREQVTRIRIVGSRDNRSNAMVLVEGGASNESHEPDESRGSSAESVSASGVKLPAPTPTDGEIPAAYSPMMTSPILRTQTAMLVPYLCEGPYKPAYEPLKS